MWAWASAWTSAQTRQMLAYVATRAMSTCRCDLQSNDKLLPFCKASPCKMTSNSHGNT